LIALQTCKQPANTHKPANNLQTLANLQTTCKSWRNLEARIGLELFNKQQRFEPLKSDVGCPSSGF